MQSQVYSKLSVEFIAVASEYCSMIEQVSGIKRDDLLLRMSFMLPLLYLKASMLPTFDYLCDDAVDEFVNEPEYYIRMHGLLDILGDKNDYLVFRNEDAQFEDAPQVASIAEDLTDIYQHLKNCVMSYQLGTTEVMNDALLVCKQQFAEYWGIRLLGGLKAIHYARFLVKEENEK